MPHKINIPERKRNPFGAPKASTTSPNTGPIATYKILDPMLTVDKTVALM